jgi:hypothetical protein
MPDPENDSYVQARRELARRVASPGSTSLMKEQGRVIELMRRRARGSSLASLYSRMQELERENEQLRRGPTEAPHGGIFRSGEGK